MICRAGGLTQKFVMHMLQTMVKPALHLLYSSTIEESEPGIGCLIRFYASVFIDHRGI